MWAVEWRQAKKSKDYKPHLVCDCYGVLLIHPTRKAAENWIKREFGYIATRQDLRSEPSYWRMPQPVRVRVEKVENERRDGKGVLRRRILER